MIVVAETSSETLMFQSYICCYIKMASFILSLALIAMTFFINGITGSTGDLPEHQETKRSYGLVSDLLRQMTAEQHEREAILEKFRKMEDKLDDVKRELKERNTLLHDTKFLQKKLEGLVKDFKEEIRLASKNDVKKALDSFGASMSTISKGLKLKISSLKKKTFHQMKLFRNEIVAIQNEVANHTQKAHTAVAFSVKLGRQVTTSSTIMFHTVLTNVGGGYHTNAGAFYCPKDGMYMFSVTLQSYYYQFVKGYIMKNDVQLALLYNQAYTTAYPSTSLTLMIQLKTNDRVWVKGTGHKYNDYSYFSGSVISL